MKSTYLLLVTALTLLAAIRVQGQDNLHVQDRELEVDDTDGGIFEDEPNYPADIMLIGSDNSRASYCKQKKSCKKSGGTCKAKGTCTGKSTKGCSRGCDCCLPIPAAEQCAKEGGSCLKSGDICNGTIKILNNSCKDQCICCVPDGSECDGGIRIGNKCLRFSADSLSWTEAAKACANKNGRLASFEDNPWTVLEYVVTNYGDYVNFWIGGSDTAKEGNWVWQSGKPLGNNFPWAWNQPDNAGDNEDCLMVNWERSYNDDLCTKKMRYICEDGIECDEGVRIGNKCLIFNEDSLSWTEAAKACANKNGRLASFEDNPWTVLEYAVTNYGDSETFWVGGSDTAKEGNWVWQSGKPLGNNFPWAWQQPDNAFDNEDCLMVNWKHSYNDDLCTKKKRYICEVPDKE